MMNCKQATYIMSQSQDRKLTLKERIHLKFHLAMCSGCKNCNRQMGFIRKTMEQFSQR